MLSTPALKLLAAAGLAALTVSACGRRGALEPPQTAAPARTAQASATANGSRSLPEAEAVRAGDELSPVAVPPSGTEAPVETSRGARRGYRIPKEPFLLDPLL